MWMVLGNVLSKVKIEKVGICYYFLGISRSRSTGNHSKLTTVSTLIHLN